MIREVRQCDHTGTFRHVKPYKLTLVLRSLQEDQEDQELEVFEIDLGDVGIRKLKTTLTRFANRQAVKESAEQESEESG